MSPISEAEARQLLAPLEDLPQIQRRERSPRRRAGRPVAVLASTTCLLAAGAFLVQDLSGREDKAQAVVRHVLNAWDQTGILHVDFVDAGAGRPKPLHLETWTYADPATGVRYERDVHPGPGEGTRYPVGQFATVTAQGVQHHSDYDPATRKVSHWSVELNGLRATPVDEFATPERLKAILQRPGAHVEETTYRGTPAYTIVPRDGEGEPLAGLVLTFTREDYRLLELRYRGGSATYRTFEILPPTPANIALTRLPADLG
jgi:hypothetical protein